MDGALGWLSSLMESIGHLFPRFKHVESNQLGVMFTRGKAKAIGPGMHWYWPVWSRPSVHCCVRQTFSLSTQNLTTADGKTAAARAQVVIEISDAMLAFVKTSSIEEVIADMASNGVKTVISRFPLQRLIESPRAVDAALSRKMRADLKDFGVHVVRAFLSDFAPAKVICLVQD